MLYSKFLKKMKECPFCKLKQEEILKENKNAHIILARAPYSRDHLLVISKKHKKRIKDLTLQRREI